MCGGPDLGTSFFFFFWGGGMRDVLTSMGKGSEGGSHCVGYKEL